MKTNGRMSIGLVSKWLVSQCLYHNPIRDLPSKFEQNENSVASWLSRISENISGMFPVGLKNQCNVRFDCSSVPALAEAREFNIKDSANPRNYNYLMLPFNTLPNMTQLGYIAFGNWICTELAIRKIIWNTYRFHWEATILQIRNLTFGARRSEIIL